MLVCLWSELMLEMSIVFSCCLIQVPDLELKAILSADEAPVVVHGSYFKAWESIKTTVSSRVVCVCVCQ